MALLPQPLIAPPNRVKLTYTPLAGGPSTTWTEGPVGTRYTIPGLVGWWKLTDAAVGFGAEIVTNGGFETYTVSPGVPDGWAVGSGATYEKDVVVFAEGVQSLKQTRLLAGGSSYLRQVLAGLVAGKSYLFRYKVRPGGAYDCHIKIRNVTDGVDVAGTTTGSSVAGAWTEILRTFTPLAGKTYELHAHVNFGGAIGDFANFDAVSIKEFRAFDSSGNGNHGVLKGGSNGAGPLPLGAAGMDFDGTDDRVELTLPAIGPAFTIVARVILDLAGATRMVISGPATSNRPSIEISSARNASAIHRDAADAAGVFTASTGSLITAGVEALLIYTHDGVTARIYVDGIQRDSDAYAPLTTIPAGTWRLGVYGSGGTFPFDGRLRHVQIYQRAITASEAAFLFQEGQDGRFDPLHAPITGLSSFRRLLDCKTTQTQSIGDQGAELLLDNVGGLFNGVTSGGILRVEAQRLQDAALTLLVEGFVGEPRARVREGRPTLRVPVVGANSILDLIELTEDKTYSDVAYTAMFDDLCLTHLAGYTRTITADAAVGSATFRKGMKLREALDHVRRSLNAATSPSKWEMTASLNAAVREITLFKRGAVNQATIRFSEALDGTEVSKGSAYHVVNRATVRGATVPSQVMDKTDLAVAGSALLDALNDYAAQPFVALDTPLSAHTLHAGRSRGKDPPSLQGVVVRNSDNWDRAWYAAQARPIGGATVLRSKAPLSGSIANLVDHNTATQYQSSFVNGVETELVVYDFGAGGFRAEAMDFRTGLSIAAADNVKVYGSNDDAAYTLLYSGTASAAINYQVFSTVGTYRYYKVTITSASTKTWVIQELHLIEFKNLSADVTNPANLFRDDDGGGVATVTVTGAMTKELWRVDMQSARPIAKFAVKHNESSGNLSVTLRLQRSDDGAAWTDIAILASTGSVVVDTIYIEGEPDARHLRLVIQDDRAGGSAAITTNGEYLYMFYHVDGFHAPLLGDAMRGSTWTWNVGSLVTHPDLMERTTWPAPRLALITGRHYWFVYKPQTGAGATSYWTLSYGTDATTPAAALASADAGATWASLGVNATLLHRTEFNEHELEATAVDAASQAAFANFVPGGVLSAALKDEALTTQDMVTKAAQSELLRSSIRPRPQIIIPLRFLTPGNPITLAPDWLIPTGVSGVFDVLEVHHDVVVGKSVLILNDHPPLEGRAVEAALTYATQRTI